MIARRLVEKNTRGLTKAKRIPKQPPLEIPRNPS